MTATEIRWTENAGKLVKVHAPQGSFAATVASAQAQAADQIAAVLRDLLKPPADVLGGLLDIYLIDPVAAIPGALSGSAGNGGTDVDGGIVGPEGVVVTIRSGENQMDAIAQPVTASLLSRWFGTQAAEVTPIVSGLAGLAAASTELGPSVEAYNESLRADLAEGAFISILVPSGGGPEGAEMPLPEPGKSMGSPGGRPGGPMGPGAGKSMGSPGGGPGGPMGSGAGKSMGSPSGGPGGPMGPGGEDLAPAAASNGAAATASFVAWLIDTHGGEALARFLADYRSDRRDEAAVSVYHRPLGALEEEWLDGLDKGEGRSVAGYFRFLLPLLRPQLPRYLESFLYMLIAATVGLFLPLTSGCVVAALSRPPDAPEPGGLCGFVAPELTESRVMVIVLVLVVAHLFDIALGLRRSYVQNELFKRIGMSMQDKMFSKLQRLSHGYYGRARVGDLMARLGGDVEEVAGAMNQVFGTGVLLTLTGMFAAVTSILKSPQVGLIVLVLVPLFLLSHKVLGSRIRKASYQAMEQEGAVLDSAQENLSAHPVVKAFGLEERAAAGFRSRLEGALRANLRMTLVGQLYGGTINAATTLSRVLILGIGSILVINGTLDDPGTMVTLLLLLPQIFVPVGSLADVAQTLESASGSVERVNEVLEHPLEIDDAPDAQPLGHLSQEIRFDDVNFGYEEHRPILKNLSLVIPAGTNVAVVGPSGSGKSTMVSLIMRFWDPQSGRVTFDGRDLREATLTSLRSQIGIVFQETFIFNTTLRDNIAIGRLDATDAEIEAAAEAARLQSYIEGLPAGFDTVLGERGVRMSGGQRQRLAIARALLRDPPLLLLDEATSALDARTESEILDTLADVMKNRTTVTITHRLVMASNADYIYVLDQGRLIEQGTHEELSKGEGLYQRLYEEQTGVSVSAAARSGLEAARLRKVPLFADLEPDALAELGGQLQHERFAPGEEIVRQGEPGDKLYIITRGAADVMASDGRTERRLDFLKEGDYFGDYALLTGEERSATVRTTAPTEVYSLSATDFAALVEREPTIQAALAAFAAERLASYEAAAAAAGIPFKGS